ncbi:zinc-binding alcohol dehydrogenase family protein [Halopseudomonas phragmitis]|uniref:Zinc-type alcohol dehydrogenase-like protein n=2 Tax=Pseudomonadaceae TaxID=135621 RepID=A0A1V0B2A0_9GAMM|nr:MULTISPECIES: zinc-binding alcohol dehydrogenase family protein [Pseudomonadaceae]AQZ94068.1 NADPH:quinone reductase [Halopseudomonas phragmitis]RHW20822.1 zinc-binding alcohol dehydrogenase family protein [Pseudomonas jilinensis]
MKAVGYLEAGTIERADALIDLELPMPSPGPRDLLVKVAAIAVNPVDTKIRRNRAPQNGQAEVLGWDAVGIVEAVGAEVEAFKPGDRVFYAGALNRPGCNAEYHLVDERIVGHAPQSLSDAEAAALPLTSITAWELLFDRLGVLEGGGAGQTLLVMGGAGGVGSILVQLARQLTALTVVATASRPQSIDWVKDLGAHQVIDHNQPLLPQLQALGIEQVDLVASLTHTSEHFDQYVECLAPQGKLGLIDDFDSLDILKLKPKSLSLHWEFMYTRSLHQTPDMAEQGRLLSRVAGLIEQGTLRTTLGEHYGNINAANLMRAHRLLESHQARGKIVLEGF